jgi:hypothetical protein
MDTNKDTPEVSQKDPLTITQKDINKIILTNLKLQQGVRQECLECTCRISIMNTLEPCPLHLKEIKRRSVQKNYNQKHKKERKKDSKKD